MTKKRRHQKGVTRGRVCCINRRGDYRGTFIYLPRRSPSAKRSCTSRWPDSAKAAAHCLPLWGSTRCDDELFMADRITQIVCSTGFDPRHMILEIIETAAMTEVAHAVENLARLRIRGFGLLVND